MIVVNEIIRAELPEQHSRLDGIEHFIQNEILLQRAIAARPIGEDFHAELLVQESVVGVLIGDCGRLSEGVSNDEHPRFSGLHIAILPKAVPAL